MPADTENLTVGAEIKYIDKEARAVGGKDTSDMIFSLELAATIP